jgi:hypothetical protein
MIGHESGGGAFALPEITSDLERDIYAPIAELKQYPRMVRQLEADLPELLAFLRFPRHLWRKLRTTNIIEPLLHRRCWRRSPPPTGDLGLAVHSHMRLHPGGTRWETAVRAVESKCQTKHTVDRLNPQPA